jgi:hypothetical protein
VFDEGDNGSVLKKARLPGKIFQLLPENRLQQQQQHQPAPESLQKSRIEVELRGTVQNGLDVFEARIRKATSIIYGRKTESVNLSTMMDRYLQCTY